MPVILFITPNCILKIYRSFTDKIVQLNLGKMSTSYVLRSGYVDCELIHLRVLRFAIRMLRGVTLCGRT